MRVTLIAAVAANGVIGKDGEMPWHYPEDLRHFKQTTLDHPVILGRVTYEAIIRRLDSPLPGRTNIVLTSDPSRVEPTPENVRVATTVEDAIEHARETGAAEVFVAGGASVYEQFLGLADRAVLTEIHQPHDGDTTFPALDDREWEAVERDAREQLSFVTYRRADSTDAA